MAGDQAGYYHRAGLALARNPKWRGRAERYLKTAAKLDPFNARHLAALGNIYLKAGMRRRAEKVFQEAGAIDPDFSVPQPR